MPSNSSVALQSLIQSEGKSSSKIHQKVLDTLGSKPTKLLDLGCGQGTFLSSLAKLGWRELSACDGYAFRPHETIAFSFVQANLNDALPYPDHSFDSVTAIEVIEHLENPRHFVREIFRILRPGGQIVVTTPNVESITSLLSLLMRGYFSAFSDRCYPAHITPLLITDLKRIFAECGFATIEVGYTDEGRIAGTNLHWQSVSPFFKGRLYSDNYLLSGFKSK